MGQILTTVPLELEVPHLYYINFGHTENNLHTYKKKWLNLRRWGITQLFGNTNEEKKKQYEVIFGSITSICFLNNMLQWHEAERRLRGAQGWSEEMFLTFPKHWPSKGIPPWSGLFSVAPAGSEVSPASCLQRWPQPPFQNSGCSSV